MLPGVTITVEMFLDFGQIPLTKFQNQCGLREEPLPKPAEANADEEESGNDEEDGECAPGLAGGGGGKKRSAASSGTGQKPAKAAKQWWDRDTAIASKVRSESTALCTLELQAQARLDESRQFIGEVSKKPVFEEVSVEFNTLTKRMGFLEAVLDPSSAKLATLVKQYEPQPALAGQVGASAGDGSSTAWQTQVQNAPPCASFKNLTCIAKIKSCTEEYWQCQTSQALKDMVKMRAEQRKPLTELLGAVSAGLKELKKAVASYEQRLAKRASKGSGKARRSSKGGAAPAPNQPIFEQGVAAAAEIPSFSASAVLAGNDILPPPDKPFLLKLDEHGSQLLEAQCCQRGQQFAHVLQFNMSAETDALVLLALPNLSAHLPGATEFCDGQLQGGVR